MESPAPVLLESAGGSPEHLDSISRDILDVLATSERPMGAESVYYVLSAKGKRRSAPTIGRRMRELELAGLLAKVSVEGRVITEAGRKALETSRELSKLRQSGEALLVALAGSDQTNVLALLEARLLMEGAAAGLAAERATDSQVAAMTAAIERQHQRVQAGELGVEEDIQLHELIGEASGNPFVAALISLLRRHAKYSYLITQIRSRARDHLVVDHWRILGAIKMHDPAAAREAMEAHLRQLIADVKTLWPGESRGRRRSKA